MGAHRPPGSREDGAPRRALRSGDDASMDHGEDRGGRKRATGGRSQPCAHGQHATSNRLPSRASPATTARRAQGVQPAGRPDWWFLGGGRRRRHTWHRRHRATRRRPFQEGKTRGRRRPLSISMGTRNSCSPAQRDVIRALAQLGGEEPAPVADIAIAAGKARTSDISVARVELIKKSLVYAPERGLLAFTVPGMHEFVARQS